jgi:glycosyltransferase involved in cell wall biosynthesis
LTGTRQKVCFFARVDTPSILERVEFYAQDIQILKDLGFDVHIATRLRDLRLADLYFVWWWTWAFFPVSLARFLDRLIVITGVIDLGVFDQRASWHKKLIEYALARADANIFISKMEYEQVPERFRVRRPYYSPLTVDTETYRQNGHRRQDVVLSVALLEEANAIRKGVPELIQAARIIHQQHPEVRFIVAGQKGSGYPALQRMVRELEAEDYIEFPGDIPAQEKIELMQSCAVYLQPSRFEGFGLAILEAMSCGAAVVTTAAGAIPEVVGDTAIQVDGRSPESIAKEVSHLLADQALRAQLGESARRRAATVFPYARRKRDLEKMIKGLLENPLANKNCASVPTGRLRSSGENR